MSSRKPEMTRAERIEHAIEVDLGLVEQRWLIAHRGEETAIEEGAWDSPKLQAILSSWRDLADLLVTVRRLRAERLDRAQLFEALEVGVAVDKKVGVMDNVLEPPGSQSAPLEPGEK